MSSLKNKIVNFLQKEIKLTHFALLMSFLNFIFFYYPFFVFVFNNINVKSFGGILLIVSLVVAVLFANAFVFYLVVSTLRFVGRGLLALTFLISSIAIYFVNTYNIIVDEGMISNVFNTNYEESSAFFSIKLIIYFIVMGVLPSIYIFKAKIINESAIKILKKTLILLLFLVILAFVNAVNWLWVDKNSKSLGGLAMPWSYSVNTALHFIHKSQQNQKEILLPDAQIKNNEKAVVVLVIGESARSQNFSLYGYSKNTNPLLSQTENLFHFPAESCATYTTAGVKCILEHEDTGKLYEILPNYLNRNGVEVIWRTSNWGEPPVHIEKYMRESDLLEFCEENCDYEEILLAGMKEQILQSQKDKILIVLHTSTSHGPKYNKKYPSEFEVFKPVCESVELGECSKEELLNAYDNTIVYTDYILHRVIEDLKQLPDYKSTMLYVSDHGESLGEKNLYTHGLPMSIAPKEQYEIPFIIWKSGDYIDLKPNEKLTQNHVFHSVLKFLSVESPIYNENMNIFK